MLLPGFCGLLLPVPSIKQLISRS